ncbi:MAG: hypothetical protein ACLR8P_13870 [Clostridium fessum]
MMTEINKSNCRDVKRGGMDWGENMIKWQYVEEKNDKEWMGMLQNMRQQDPDKNSTRYGSSKSSSILPSM